MTPRAIAIWILAVAPAGAALYAVKEEVRAIEAKIVETEAETAALRGAEAVLEAEWAYLTAPERIAALSRTHLGLEPLGPARALPVDALPMRTAEPSVARPDAAPTGAAPPAPVPVPAPVPTMPPAHRLNPDDLVAAPWR